MKLSREELSKISVRLRDLSTECLKMHDEAKFASRFIGCYGDASDGVESRLQSVLRRFDKLLDDLHCAEAALDVLLVQHKVVLDDEEMERE